MTVEIHYLQDRVHDMWESASWGERDWALACAVVVAIALVRGDMTVAFFSALVLLVHLRGMGWKADCRYWWREYKRTDPDPFAHH